MKEIDFTKELVQQLKPSFPGYELQTGISIFYSLYIDESGNIPINQNENGEPIRGRGTGFEQDVLLYECVSGQTSIVPRVAIEVKFGGVTTHDAIVYSEKARRLRNVYPYLRYGFLIGDVLSLPPRLLRLGLDFDFILRMTNPPLSEEKMQLTSLLKEEIETSQKLGRIFSRLASVELIRRKVEIKPQISISAKTTKLIPQSDFASYEKPKENPSENRYFVYENWRAEKKAVIHFGNCSSCNYGKGIHPKAETHNGRWHGPFSSFANAQRAAKETGRSVRVCKKCTPGEIAFK